MRPCILFKREQVPNPQYDGQENPPKKTVKVQDCVGVFHQWGMDSEEFTEGVANFTTAIVERPDGTVANVSVDMIQFLDKPDPAA